MIGIKSIASYIPNQHIDNMARLAEFNITEDFLLHKTGMLKVARKSTGEETSDLCCTAILNLAKKENLDLNKIECMVVCTQNPDQLGLPHTSAIVHGKLKLSNSCAVFDISLGCSGYVYGLSILKSFMMANEFEKGILVTADPYSKITNKHDKNTTLLFGDAATATLLTSDPEWAIGKFCFGSDGSHNDAIKLNPITKSLEMDGRRVFNFTAKVIPDNINKTIEINGLNKDNIDLFALHQGSRYIRDTLIKRLKIPVDKTPFEAAQYGNTVSSSIPLILENKSEGITHALLSGFGVGLSWASTVITNLSNKTTQQHRE